MSRFFSPSTTGIVVPESRIRLEADGFQGAWTVTIAASNTCSIESKWGVLGVDPIRRRKRGGTVLLHARQAGLPAEYLMLTTDRGARSPPQGCPITTRSRRRRGRQHALQRGGQCDQKSPHFREEHLCAHDRQDPRHDQAASETKPGHIRRDTHSNPTFPLSMTNIR
jgi:hypothetical protein